MDHVLTERDGRTLVVTINRPDRMNALHPPANAELEQVFNDFAADPDLWVAIITGAGERAFSAGNDLRWQAEGNPITVPRHRLWRPHHALGPRQAGHRRGQRCRHGRRL